MASLSLGRTKLRLVSTFMLALGLVVQPFSMVMANSASAVQADVVFTNLSAWDLGQTRSSGHNEIVAGGLRIWTDDSTSLAKAAGYYDVVDAGLAGFTDFSLSWTGTTPAPGGQLVVDMNGNGTLDGILVVEPVYGGNQWLASINTADLNLTNAPTVGGGGGVYNGTFAQWLSAYPDAKVSAFGYSLGSGVLGDGVISSITAGGVNYAFDLPTVATIGSTNYYTLQTALLAASAGDTIELLDDVTLSEQLTITKAVTLNGNGHTITGAFVKTNNSNNSVIGVQSDDVTISNLTLNAVSGATNQLHGVNIYESDYVELTNVTAVNGRSGIVVGQGSEVYASGITTAGNIWHGINVDKPDSYLQISGTNAHSEARQIFVDDKMVGTVNDIDNQYSVFEEADAHTYVLTVGLTNLGTGTVTLPASGGVAKTPVDSPLTLSQGQTTVVIPAGTTVSANPAWDGTMLAPTASAFTVPGDFQTGAAIALGSNTYTLTFDAPVKIVLAGQAGKRVGFVPALSSSFTEITTVCGADDQATVDAQMLALGVNECKINSGNDLVVWTNHFTTFATYTPQPVTQSTNTSSTSTTRSGNFFSETIYDDTWMDGANTKEGETFGDVKSKNVGVSGAATVNDAQEVPAKGISWYWWLLGGVLAAGAWSLVSLLRSGRFNR